jgi:uncharacterized protein YkwD
VHHRPSGPPLSARLTGALTGVVLVFRGRLGRLLGAALLTTTVVGLVLAIPVVSGAGGESPSVTLDAASSSASDDDEVSSPVVMGLDGRPLPPTTSAQTSTTVPPSSSSAAADSPEVAAAPDTTDPAPPATSADAPSSSSSQPPSSPRTTAPGSTPTSSAGSPTTPTTPSSPSSPTSSAERPAAEPADLSDDAREALALVNAARADVGCTALHPDAGLISAAEAQSASQELELDGLVGVVAQGRPNAQSAVSSWLADEAGSAALLDCARTSAGVAAIDGWWTLLLA